jgi:transcriptional regulator with XRE-family HTH domain
VRVSGARPWTGAGIAPTVQRVILSELLGRLRERAGVSREAAAEIAGTSAGTIRRIELAETAVKISYVKLLLPEYLRGLPESEREVLSRSVLQLADDASANGWWHGFRDALPDWFTPFVSLEAVAAVIRSYAPHYLPGLLQTADYARALLRVGFPQDHPDDLERKVQARLTRQRVLEREDPPKLWVLLDENVLRRPVGGPAVMAAMLDGLLEAVQEPHITVQVIPDAAGPHPGTFGPFSLFRLPPAEEIAFRTAGHAEPPVLPDIVYAEGLTRALYIDERPEVRAYQEALDRMAASYAVSVRETPKYLMRYRKEYR